MSTGAGGRLAGPAWGLLIDRAKPVTFTFEGEEHRGFDGDVIASALYAEGRRLISRSSKYHRPRGVLTMAGHDANALVTVADEPHVRADRMRISPGLDVRSTNRLGSLDRDLLGALDLLGRFLPAGYYFRTFFRPRGAWKIFERPLRHAAGLGRLGGRARPRN
jgi:sarcosine oxidase subunit alpha